MRMPAALRLLRAGVEVLAGLIQGHRADGARSQFHWFSDIEVVERGRGRLIFCQYRLFTAPGRDPLADRMRRNLLRLAAEYPTP